MGTLTDQPYKLVPALDLPFPARQIAEDLPVLLVSTIVQRVHFPRAGSVNAD